MNFTPFEVVPSQVPGIPAEVQAGVAPGSLFTEELLNELHVMFPRVDKDVIQIILEENRGDTDSTVTTLFEIMSLDSSHRKHYQDSNKATINLPSVNDTNSTNDPIRQKLSTTQPNEYISDTFPVICNKKIVKSDGQLEILNSNNAKFGSFNTPLDIPIGMPQGECDDGKMVTKPATLGTVLSQIAKIKRSKFFHKYEHEFKILGLNELILPDKLKYDYNDDDFTIDILSAKHRIIHLKTGFYFDVTMVQIPLNNETVVDKFLQEIKTCMKLRDRPQITGVLQLYGCIIPLEIDYVYLCTEPMDICMKEIYKRFHAKSMDIPQFPEGLLGGIGLIILYAMQELLKYNINDDYLIKPEQIFINKQGVIKISDVKLNVYDAESLTYYSPKRLQGQNETHEESLLWSLAISLTEMAFGAKSLYPSFSYDQVINKIKTKTYSNNIKMLIFECLCDGRQISKIFKDCSIVECYSTYSTPEYVQEILENKNIWEENICESELDFELLKVDEFSAQNHMISNQEITNIAQNSTNLHENGQASTSKIKKIISDQELVNTETNIKEHPSNSHVGFKRSQVNVFAKNENIDRLIFPDGKTGKFEYSQLKIGDEIDTGKSNTIVKYAEYMGVPIAIKIINIPFELYVNEKIENFLKNLKREQEVLSKLYNAPNIIHFYGFVNFDKEVLLFMELMNCSLFHLYSWFINKLENKTCNFLPEELHGGIVVSMLEGLNYCKEHNIIHRDIKPHNILLNVQGEIKLGDFGESRPLYNSFASSTVGTLMYWAPERFVNESYDIRADVWSLGITLAEVALGKPPHIDPTKINHAKNFVIVSDIISKIRPEEIVNKCFNGKYSIEACDFLRLCLQSNYKYRPSYKELKQKAFYNKYQNRDTFTPTMKNLLRMFESFHKNEQMDHEDVPKF